MRMLLKLRSPKAGIAGMILLGCSILFSPLVWMKIGPIGKMHCGFDVPDIYIYGRDIYGKDKGFDGISFAWRFQLLCILFCIAMTVIAFFNTSKVRLTIRLLTFDLLMLIVFPWWIGLYISGVVCNSDCATIDMDVKPHIGSIFYLLLLFLNIYTLVGLKKLKPK